MARPAPGFAYSGQAKNRLSYNEIKRLAQAYGLPGDAIAQIAKGESGMYADVQQRDPGDHMIGYGLLQMTPNAWGKGSAAYKYMQKLGGIQAMKDPAKNMAMARFLYKSAGNKLTPWYGTRFLTNRSGEGKLGPVDRSLLQRLTGGNSGAAAGGMDTASGGRTRTTTTITPGVDNSRERALLVQQFLGNDNSDVLDFAMQARNLQDIPEQRTSTTQRLPGSSSSPSSGGSRRASARGIPGSHKSNQLLELFYDPQGGWKRGQSIGPIGGHSDHVHVAAGPRTVVQLGKLAQQMGLHVGENPRFGGVAPVHVQNSYHYKGEAIDVSGSPAKMAAYARRVRRIYGLK